MAGNDCVGRIDGVGWVDRADSLGIGPVRRYNLAVIIQGF
jgi:hypothetical protein